MWFQETFGIGHPCVSAEVVQRYCAEAESAECTGVILVSNCFTASAVEEARRIEDDPNSIITSVKLQISEDS